MSQAGFWNFGYSGGVNNSNRLAAKTWHAVGFTMDFFNVDWFFGMGCRYPSHCDLKTEVPSFHYTHLGPRTSEFNAVGAFFATSKDPANFTLLHTRRSSKSIVWLSIGTKEVWCGVNLPPRHRGGNEKERQDLVALLWEQYDEINHRFRAGAGSGRKPPIIGVCGDFNPSDDIDDLVARGAAQRGLARASPDSATHVRGRCLDMVWLPRDQVIAITLHDGKLCREMGCDFAACGDSRLLLGTHNFDHFASTWPSASLAGQPLETHRLVYLATDDSWTVPLAVAASPPMRAIQVEVNDRHASTCWQRFSTQQHRQALSTLV